MSSGRPYVHALVTQLVCFQAVSEHVMAESIIEMVQHLIYENQHEALDVVDIPESTVFEVPAHVRALSPASFQNKGLHLGLHHRTLQKSRAESLKFDIARILHSKLATRNSSWEYFAQSVVGDVNRARRVYPTSSAKFKDEEIQHFLALDALFLVVLFKYCNGREYFLKEFEALEGRLREITTIDKTDFFLVENQVPMYLLQSAIRELCEIDDETVASRVADPNFQMETKVEDELEMILNEAVLDLNPFTYPENTGNDGWLNGAFCSQQALQNSRDRLHQHLTATYPVAPLAKSLINCQHILDCLYRVICGHLLPFKVEEGTVKNAPPLETIPSATHLGNVGIRVVGTVPTLREISLSGTGYLRSAKLQLPQVALHDYSESAFHNLALHEQLVSGGECGDLRCYLQCMASLCVDVSDLQILSEKGVINNHTGNGTLLGMWDRTLKGILTPYPSSLWERCYRGIHRHRNSRLKRWRSEYWALFFAKPWTLVSVVAATLLLFLTAIQAWFTVYPRK